MSEETTERVLRVIDDLTTGTARSLYAASRKVGVSDIGSCREYVRRLLIDEEFSDDPTSKWPAFVGTAVGDLMEQGYVKRYKNAISQASVTVPIEVATDSGSYQIRLPGHPDIVDPDADLLIDWKTKDGLGVVRSGAIPKDWFQVMLYAKACIKAGWLTEGCRVAIVYLDRSGAESVPVIHERQYDPDVIQEAEAWLEDVIYAIEHNEEAERDQPRTFCESYCPYVSACRGRDTDVEGLLTDPEVIKAVDLLVDARVRAAEANADKKAATAVLAGINGHTDTHSVRNTWVNETEYTTKRAGYMRLDVRKRK